VGWLTRWAGHPLGLTNPALHALSTDHALGLADITSGNNTAAFTGAKGNLVTVQGPRIASRPAPIFSRPLHSTNHRRGQITADPLSGQDRGRLTVVWHLMVCCFTCDGWAFVEFGVLGQLQINGSDVTLAGKPRIVLVALLLHANQIVSVDALVDALWDDAPPASARTTLQGYVKQLRRLRAPVLAERIVTRSPGYLIRVLPGEVDLSIFAGLSDRGQGAARAGDWERASALFADALALWRGQPLGDVPSAVLQRTEVPRLTELRMRAVESRVEADMRLGRYGELVADLRRLTSLEPGRVRSGLVLAGRSAATVSGRRAGPTGNWGRSHWISH
jgi:DNA-binding SARP family transcriptional activator